MSGKVMYLVMFFPASCRAFWFLEIPLATAFPNADMSGRIVMNAVPALIATRLHHSPFLSGYGYRGSGNANAARPPTEEGANLRSRRRTPWRCCDLHCIVGTRNPKWCPVRLLT